MENDLEIKQSFLRAEILDKGYDGQEFFDFLIQKKGEEGGDLNNWLMEDLKIIVTNFHQTHKSNQKSDSNIMSQNSNIQNGNEDTDNIPTQQNIIEKITPDNNEQIENENIMEIKCKENENGELSKYENLIIKLSFPEKKVESSGLLSLFSKTISITYNITTEPINKSVRRRYTDFEWLRNIFTKLYPSIFIPPIPLKTLKENPSDQKIEKRMRALERFLNNVVQQPLLRNSNICYEFLCTENESDFEKVKIKYEKYKFPALLNDIQTLDGKILLDRKILTKPNIFKNIHQNFTKNQELLNRLITSYKRLFNEMKQVSNRMMEISDIYKRIYDLSSKMGENKNLCESYKSMQTLMENWGYAELHSALNIDLEVKEYFKFVKLEYNCIKELYEKYDNQRNSFFESRDELDEKKERLYKEGDVNKWDLPKEEKINMKDKETVINKMLPKETNQLYNLKLWLFYYATSLNEEFERIREIISIQNKITFKQFFDKNSKVIEELNKAFLIFKDN